MAGPTTAMGPGAGARRLTRQARRQQLIAAGTALVARHGLSQLSLEDLADRAGVTRNLLYHYFPRGRSDVAIEVVRVAERQLVADWTAAEKDGLEAGLSRILDHALAPTHAWRIHLLARRLPDPELAGVTEELVGAVVSRMAAEAGVQPTTPIQLAALRGYVAFAESALEQARRARIHRQDIGRLLLDTLAALPLGPQRAVRE